MKFHDCKVLIILLQCIGSITLLEIQNIGEQLDNIFLKAEITLNDSRAILANAKESYLAVKSYQSVKDEAEQKDVARRLGNLPPLVVDDLSRPDMTLQRFFEDMKDYLTGDVPAADTPQTDHLAVTYMVQAVLTESEQRLSQHYAKLHRTRYDVGAILSGNETDAEDIMRAYDIEPSSIGYFFLESFATILGLSWGIVSMIFANSG